MIHVLNQTVNRKNTVYPFLKKSFCIPCWMKVIFITTNHNIISLQQSYHTSPISQKSGWYDRIHTNLVGMLHVLISNHFQM